MGNSWQRQRPWPRSWGALWSGSQKWPSLAATRHNNRPSVTWQTYNTNSLIITDALINLIWVQMWRPLIHASTGWMVPPYLPSPFFSVRCVRFFKIQLFHIFLDPLHPSLLTSTSSPNTRNLNFSTFWQPVTLLLSLHVTKPPLFSHISWKNLPLLTTSEIHSIPNRCCNFSFDTQSLSFTPHIQRIIALSVLFILFISSIFAGQVSLPYSSTVCTHGLPRILRDTPFQSAWQEDRCIWLH